MIDERRVQELPLFAGNPMELTLIATGVVNATDMRLRKAGFNNAPSQFSSDGNGQFNNDFTIDGIPNNFPVGNGQSRVAFSPPVYSVKEFKIQTSSYDATVGRTIGALTNVNTASGGNGLHGEVALVGAQQLSGRSKFLQQQKQHETHVLRRSPLRRVGGWTGPAAEGLQRARQDLLVLRLGEQSLERFGQLHCDSPDGQTAAGRFL